MSAAALRVPCPWCGSGAGVACVTRAAHPVTGRAMLLDVDAHPERLEVLRCSHRHTHPAVAGRPHPVCVACGVDVFALLDPRGVTR